MEKLVSDLALFTWINIARYLVIAGSFYLIFWVIFREKMKSRRIQQIPDDKGQIIREFLYSLMSSFIFAVAAYLIFYLHRQGKGLIYFNISEFGWAYFIFSVILMLLVQDMAFYWSHRFMHLPFVFKLIHAVHHRSKNPSPWAAYCFHPGDAFLQVVGATLVLSIMPVHPAALGVFTNISLLFNCFGHLGYELLPSGFTTGRFTRWMNTPVHHNMHHLYANANYGLIFNWWDRLCKTNHPRYHENFEEVVARRKKT